MRIQADKEGQKVVSALCDAALKLHGEAAFNMVAVVKEELRKSYTVEPSPSGDGGEK